MKNAESVARSYYRAADLPLLEMTVPDIVATTCLDGLVWVSSAIDYLTESTNPYHLVQLCIKPLSGILGPLCLPFHHPGLKR